MINREVQQYILCAAIHFDDGKKYNHQPSNIKTGFVICGRRHHNCFATIATIKGLDEWIEERKDYKVIQGFLTSTDLFLNREKSYSVAKECGQVTDKIIGSILTSEDLW